MHAATGVPSHEASGAWPTYSIILRRLHTYLLCVESVVCCRAVSCVPETDGGVC